MCGRGTRMYSPVNHEYKIWGIYSNIDISCRILIIVIKACMVLCFELSGIVLFSFDVLSFWLHFIDCHWNGYHLLWYYEMDIRCLIWPHTDIFICTSSLLCEFYIVIFLNIKVWKDYSIVGSTLFVSCFYVRFGFVSTANCRGIIVA